MKRLLLIVPILLASVAVGTGCGGGDDSSTSDKPAGPTKAEFITQADRICAANSAAIQEDIIKVLGGTKRPSRAQIVALTEGTIVPGFESQFKELQKLDPPKDAINDFDTFMSTYTADIDELKQNPKLAVTGQPMENSQVAARNFGFSTCGTLGAS